MDSTIDTASTDVDATQARKKSLAGIFGNKKPSKKQDEVQDQPVSSTWKGLQKQTDFQKKIILGQLVLLGLLVIVLIAKDHTTVLVPPTLNEKTEISLNQANESYKTAWASFAADLVGNVTPHNIDDAMDVIGPLLSPKIYQNVLDDMRATAEQLRLRKATSKFRRDRLTYNPNANIIWVYGYREVTLPNGNTPPGEYRTYKIKVDIVGGLPKISLLEHYKGHPNLKDIGSE